MGIILLSHIGYRPEETKSAIYQGEAGELCSAFSVMDELGKPVFSGKPIYNGSVAHWGTGEYWTLDFTPLQSAGRYTVRLAREGEPVCSPTFTIGAPAAQLRLISALCYYFKAQRATGAWDWADSHIAYDGDRPGVLDLRGGWYDATGDGGIHLSHLSHSAWYNPQQAGMCVYALYTAAERLTRLADEEHSQLIPRMLDEASFGADFLMRLYRPGGSFLRSIRRDANAFLDPEQTRKVAFEYRHGSVQFAPLREGQQEEIRDENYESSFRSGAGSAIAALAAAARHCYPGSAYTQAQYLGVAKAAWRYLRKNNERYTNDGQWNLVDEYCALLAAAELYRSSGEYEYLLAAREMKTRLAARVVKCAGGLWLETEGGVPYHHPSDEGLPVLALLNYAALLSTACQERREIISLCEQLMRAKLAVTTECVNPFLYPRFVYRSAERERRCFFFPHDTAAQPWWQGENARIASLAAAARMVRGLTEDGGLRDRLGAFADAQLQWIFGRNPFDSSMMEGVGRNQNQYFFNGRYDFVNCPGGVINGITSAPEDEDGIAFIRTPGEMGITDNWRWAEQWLPHAMWLLLALSMDK